MAGTKISCGNTRNFCWTRHDDDLAEGVTSRRIAGMVEWQEEARFVSSNEEREMLSGMMLRLQRYLTQGVALRGTYELV